MTNPTRIRGLLVLCFVSMSLGCDSERTVSPSPKEDADTSINDQPIEDTDKDTGFSDDPGEDDSGIPSELPSCDPDDVRGCLEALGVTVDTDSPRSGPDGIAMPSDYAPLGASVSFHASGSATEGRTEGASAPIGTSELFLSGVQRPRTEAPAAWLELDANDVTYTWFSTDTIKELPDIELDHALDGDIDGDGRAEVIGLKVSEGLLVASVFEDRVEGFTAASGLHIAEVQGDVSATTADIDGDGDDDLIVSTVSADGRSVTVTAYTMEEDRFIAQASAGPMRLTAPESKGTVRLSSGNVDLDRSEEIVMVIEERYESEGQPTGKAAYWVLDDLLAETGLAERSSGTVTAIIDGLPQRAELSDVVVADLDGDGLDEIAFGGLSSRSGDGDCEVAYLVVTLDDGVRHFTAGPAQRACQETAADVDVTYINALDVDGDGLLELAVNTTIFEDFLAATPLKVKYALSDADLSISSETGIDASNVRFETGDLTNDGREDLAIYIGEEGTLQIWGEANAGEVRTGSGEGGWRKIHDVTVGAMQDGGAPSLLVLDVDNADATTVKISDAEHTVIYTEPVVLAVLAAAPCYPEDRYGQDEGRCRTSFGSGETTGSTLSTSLSVTAGGAIVGVWKGDIPLVGGSKAEVTARMLATLGTSWSSSYRVTKTVTYTTAPLTDEVIFTSIPYDVYTYTIVSHPEADLIGSDLVVALPREITTYKVPLEHYERNAVAGAPDLRDAIITHTAGDPFSYPTEAEKDALVAASSELELATLVSDEESAPLLETDLIDVRDLQDLIDDFLPMGELVTMEVGPAAVNPGDGFVTQSLSYESTGVKTHSGRIKGILRLKVTQDIAGIGGGFELQVGAEAGTGLSVLRGSQTTASGAVADIPEENHAANEYDWGLFTYLHVDEATGQQIDVIQYWVD
ncbi:MAG: FG-GAP-like repeat-containing protein [Myxococcota bacterium]